MKIIKTVEGLRNEIETLRASGKQIGLVPTMGALHEGHLSLVERARKENDIVVVSVFVNPTQFNNPTDLATYPRTETEDCSKLEAAGVDIAFVPTAEEIYPEPDTRKFELGEVAEVMEGPMRPGHFNGVAQVVSKLFKFTQPTRAYFGEKDFQQIAVIKKMNEICGFNTEIVACPIKRESDGLAMSSRNVRLTTEQRQIAPEIFKSLTESVEYSKTHTPDETAQWVTDRLNSIPSMQVEYYSIVNPISMQPIHDWTDTHEGEAQGCITVYCGEVRLIDNIKYLKR